MPKEKKTNAARILDREGVTYRLVPYEVDPDNLAADHVAESLGEPVERVFKTLVLRGDREVDLKKAAKISGNKKAEMIAMKELLPATGYIRGGCTAIGMKKELPAWFSEEFVTFSEVYVSAGQRGLQLAVNPNEFLRVARGSLADITADVREETRSDV